MAPAPAEKAVNKRTEKYERKKKIVLHPWALACAKQVDRVAGSMYPLVASLAVAGLPMTILFNGTPFAAIWNTADWGHVLDDAVRRPAQVVYSVAPWL
jgi:hypothetical protein